MNESMAVVTAVEPDKVIVGAVAVKVVYSAVEAEAIVGANPVIVVPEIEVEATLVSIAYIAVVPLVICKALAVAAGMEKVEALAAVILAAPAEVKAKVPEVIVDTVKVLPVTDKLEAPDAASIEKEAASIVIASLASISMSPPDPVVCISIAFVPVFVDCKVKIPVEPGWTVKSAKALSSAAVNVTVPESFLVKVKVASAASPISNLSDAEPIKSPPKTVRSPNREALPASVIERMSVPPADCSINKALFEPVLLVFK